MQLKRSITFMNIPSKVHSGRQVWMCLTDSSNILDKNGFYPELPTIGRSNQFKIGSKVNIIVEEPEGAVQFVERKEVEDPLKEVSYNIIKGSC